MTKEKYGLELERAKVRCQLLLDRISNKKGC